MPSLTRKKAPNSIIAIALSAILSTSLIIPVFAQPLLEQQMLSALPHVKDKNLQVELVTNGLQLPTSMTFINETKIIVTQKGGTVILVSIENATAPPTRTALMKFNVTASGERGLLGVATMNSTRLSQNNDVFVFFYLTEAGQGQDLPGNKVYRYQFDPKTNSLSNGTLILELPASPAIKHNGGKMISYSDRLYLVIGDLNRNGILQNYVNDTSAPDDTSVIIRIDADGNPAPGNPFASISSLNITHQNLSKYFAFGVRNSFGLSIDPVTGILWETENGPAGYDEINIVKPGFNSGWEKVIGPIERRNVTENDLTRFPNSSYADPVFSWRETVGVTDIEFITSTRLGNNYTNNIFVGDFNNGSLYYFEVHSNRSGLKFTHPGLYDDLVASTEGQVTAVIFGMGFGAGITDIETGPDGYLYLLTYDGSIYRITPRGR